MMVLFGEWAMKMGELVGISILFEGLRSEGWKSSLVVGEIGYVE